MSIYQKAIDALRAARDEEGSFNALAKYSKVPKSSLIRWANGTANPRFEDIAALLDYLGYDIVRHSDGPFIDTSKDEDFVSVPILKDPSLWRRGHTIPTNNIAGYCKVEKHFPSVEGKNNLAVIKMEDDSMAPTMPAGSLVLVDLDDCAPEDSKIFFVRDPMTDEAGIRRVTVTPMEKDVRIAYSNDNLDQQRPRFFSLKKDFCGQICAAILGRAIWIRTEIRKN